MNNKFNGSYPLGGNYWSDYGGNDIYEGPDQDIPNSDGIGDTPYANIEGGMGSQDYYPLMEPYKPLDNHMVLKQGWNLISIPLIQEETNLFEVLGPIDGWYDAVQWYDQTDTKDPWKNLRVDKPFGNDLSEIDHTMAFWIHIDRPGNTMFFYNGTPPTQNQSITLHPGWNLVGYPSKRIHNRTTGLNNITFGNDVDFIQWYDASTKTWYEMGKDDYFVPGRGYWFHVITECEWEVPL
jgi:hypothetical protein